MKRNVDIECRPRYARVIVRVAMFLKTALGIALLILALAAAFAIDAYREGLIWGWW